MRMKNYEYIIDPRTDSGKGKTFKTLDGRDVATMEEVIEYNRMFYESMMIKEAQNQKYPEKNLENKGGKRR